MSYMGGSVTDQDSEHFLEDIQLMMAFQGMSPCKFTQEDPYMSVCLSPEIQKNSISPVGKSDGQSLRSTAVLCHLMGIFFCSSILV